MRVTRKEEYNLRISGLADSLQVSLANLGLRRFDVALALATLITISSDSGDITLRDLRASWRWDPELHLLVTLEVTTVE